MERSRKKQKIFGERKFFFAKEKKNRKEKEDNIWQRKIFGEVKYIFSGGEEKEEGK